MHLNILTIGDIVGSPGRTILEKELRALQERESVDLTVANAENVTNGSGISVKDAEALFRAGVDVITCGDHVWRNHELIALVEKDKRIVRAANFSKQAPGRGHTVVGTAKGIDVGVAHVVGRVFMQPVDCPFAAVDHAVETLRGKTRVIIVDMHGEATSEKVAMGRFLDGRVSAVFGTHTHVATADIQVLEKGTGYITDVGMTGPYESILGRRVDRVLKRFVTGMPARFSVARGDERIGAALFRVDATSGRCESARRIEVKREVEE